MMQIQEAFFETIRNKGFTGKDLTELLCNKLHISADSAYRRLRGETSLSFDEIQVLANHLNISIDALFNSDTKHVPFTYRWIEPDKFNYTDYLRSIKNDIEQLAAFEDNLILFVAKDLPFFSNFILPEIAEFKGFFWQKVVLKSSEYEDTVFDMDNLNSQNLQLGYEIHKAYNIIPSEELWNRKIISSLLNQIIYCYDSGYLSSRDTALSLINKVAMVIDHYDLQAKKGRKFLHGKESRGQSNFKLYYNDVIIGDNTTCLKTQHGLSVYFTHNVINNIETRDQKFCQQTWDIQHGMIKSSLDLGIDRERNIVFRQLRRKIEKAKEVLA